MERENEELKKTIDELMMVNRLLCRTSVTQPSMDDDEQARSVEGVSVARFCRLLGISRSSYHGRQSIQPRQQKGKRSTTRQKILNRAWKHPYYGYRRIWGLLGDERQRVGQNTVYRHLKRFGLLLAPSYQLEVRRKPKAARAKYWKKPSNPYELWQVDITWADVNAYSFYYVVNVVDYFSRFPLASHLSATHTTEDVIRGLEKATTEVRRLRGDMPSETILVSDNGPQFTSARFSEWIRKSCLRHVRGRSQHPQTTGMVEPYLEGERASIAEYGLSKDKRPDRLQIVVGVLMSRYGLPIAHEVFWGASFPVGQFDGLGSPGLI